MTQEAKEKFPNLNQCSIDKGGHSPANQKALAEIVDRVIMPKKGRLSATDKEREYAAEFVKARHQHSAVESTINALENHGLDICPDHGIDGFERYVGLAVVGRNLQIMGAILQKKDRQHRKRQQALRQSRMDQALLKAA
jgi:IS5 family transposase